MAKQNDDFKEEVVTDGDGNVDIGNVVHSTEEVDPTEEIGEIQQEAVDYKVLADEYKKQYLRALADYQNLEKRVRDERGEMMKIAQMNVISRFFPVLDIMSQAEIFIKDPGLQMVKDTFLKSLSETGVKEIELLGKEYDPHVAEVVDVVEGKDENIIVEVLQKGFEMNGKVLRPGMVKVSKKA